MTLYNLTKQPQDFRPIPDEPLRPYRRGHARPSRRHASEVQDRWRPELAHWAHHMALLGATDGEIAQALGVGYATFVRWKDEKWALADALARAARATAAVAASLYMRAVGFTYPTEKIVVIDGKVERVETTEYVPPSVEAGRYWLENKQPERWRSRQEVTGAGGSPLVPQSGDVNIAMAVLTSGRASQNDMAKAYLRVMGTPIPEAALPPPKQEGDGGRGTAQQEAAAEGSQT